MEQFHESVDVQLRASGRRLQTISAFAHSVGLSASALRQYGENGLLRPAAVDDRTGYRYYHPEQQQRAIWIRRLRDAGLSLERIKAVLDGDAADAENILDEWLANAQERSTAAEELVADFTVTSRARLDPNPVRRTCVQFDAAVLGSAIRQVQSASAHGDPDFDGVLIDAGTDSVSVTATDRYLLMGRMDVAMSIDGPPARVRVDSTPALKWLRARQLVELVIEAPTGRDHRGKDASVSLRDSRGEVLELVSKPDRFPSVHHLGLEDGEAWSRLVFDRADTLHLASSAESLSVFLTSTGSECQLAVGNRTLSGFASGAAVSLELSGLALASIANAAVARELVCDVREPDEAIVWRSPGQPDFISLVMPRLA
ncbi:MerR family transcriptional regulator [Paramicrobacterium chengjingii]|uniref:MerR family transcriptional regulator n=1 Tax=Paramicrobacterium chengjingii TaxID=2769067 RepID=A0ABX6YKP3_9MICO|nr:MerR family transcriptional regulator [Microbacterium chengjingii]QPZ39318.1 MerR family transcriptional regulator [Microbacterium chengjingii]